jgi:hypothetical protein
VPDSAPTAAQPHVLTNEPQYFFTSQLNAKRLINRSTIFLSFSYVDMGGSILELRQKSALEICCIPFKRKGNGEHKFVEHDHFNIGHEYLGMGWVNHYSVEIFLQSEH